MSDNGVSLKYDLPLQFLYSSRRVPYENGVILDTRGGVYDVSENGETLIFKKIFQLKTAASKDFPFLFRLKNNSLLYMNTTNHLVSNHHDSEEVIADVNIPYTALEDKLGNFWLTSEDGLYNFFNFSFKEYAWGLNAEKSDQVWSIAQTSDSTLWIGSYTEGLFSFKERINAVKSILPSKNSPATKFRGLYFHPVIKNDTLYYPAHEYVLVISKGKVLKVVKNDNIHDVNLFLYNDAITNSILSCGTNIRKLNSDLLFRNLISNESLNLKQRLILSICRDKYQRLWYVASDIVGYIDVDGKVNMLNMKDFGAFYSVICDSRQNLWFAGDKGLWFYDYKYLQKVEHPLLERIGALHDYKSRYLIVNGVGKLGIVNLDSFYKGKNIINVYSAANGFNGVDYRQNSIWEDNTGNIWLPTSNTVIKFHPDKMQPNTIPEVIVNTVEYSTDNVHWVTMNNNTILRYPQNNLRISFGSIAINNPGRIYYQFQLKGFTKWSLITKATQITYNVPSGKYTFEVRASLDGVRWSRIAHSNEIVIRSAWYQTLAFYIVSSLLVAVFITLAVIGVTRKRRRQIEQNKKIVSLQLQSVRNRMLPHLTNNVYMNIISLIKGNNSSLAIHYTYSLSRLNC